jgi:hypothetical protein
MFLTKNDYIHHTYMKKLLYEKIGINTITTLYDLLKIYEIYQKNEKK